MRRDEDIQPVALDAVHWSRSQFDVLHRLVPYFCEVPLYKLHSLTHFLPSSGALFGLAPIPLFLSFFLPLFLSFAEDLKNLKIWHLEPSDLSAPRRCAEAIC